MRRRIHSGRGFPFGKIMAIISVLSCALSLLAQSNPGTPIASDKCVLTYDAAGNRVSRTAATDDLNTDSLSSDLGEIIVTPTITDAGVTVKTTADLSRCALRFAMSNLTGSNVSEGVLVSPSTHLDVPPTAGIYILNISSNSGSKSFKIVKR